MCAMGNERLSSAPPAQSPLGARGTIDPEGVARRLNRGKCRRRICRSAICLLSFIVCVGSVLV